MSEEHLARIETALAGLATKAELTEAIAGVDKNIEIAGLGNQVLTLTAQLRDLQRRFTAIELRLGALETRFGALEGRFAVQEERMTGMLAPLVRLAERIEGPAPPPAGAA